MNETRARKERGDSAIPFLLVMPLVMGVFWVILQVGLSTVAAVGAQQAASETARRIADERPGSVTSADICASLERFEDAYGKLGEPASVMVQAAGRQAPACIDPSEWDWGRSSAVCDGDGDGTGAFDGVQVVIEVEALDVLPDFSDLVGLDVLNRLNDVQAASCAPSRHV